jgi:hypothetical protein
VVAVHIGFFPFAHGVAVKFDFIGPEAGIEAGFLFEVRHKFNGIGQLLPHLGQEGAAVAAVFKYQAVNTGL